MKTLHNIKKRILLCALLFGTITNVWTQVGIGTSNPDNSAALEVSSTTKGLLLPRMTQTQLLNISNPAQGLIVYCTNCSPKGIYIYDGEFFINGSQSSSIVNSITGIGGSTWMEKNLGATQIAASSTDSNAYGYLYQWGRTTDGHQSRSSLPFAGPVASGSEENNFVTSETFPDNWLTGSLDNTRWNGSTKGIHDPCPAGFRVPTKAELETERAAWSSNDAAGAFASLKLPLAGRRSHLHTAVLEDEGSVGYYWASTTSGNFGEYLHFNSSSGTTSGAIRRAYGVSIRCIKE